MRAIAILAMLAVALSAPALAQGSLSVGDAIVYSDRLGSVSMQYVGGNAFRFTYQNGSWMQETRDAAGNLLTRSRSGKVQSFSPHNASYPAQPPRQGMSWSGTYSISADGVIEQYRTKTCSITGTTPYQLRGLPTALTAYQVSCTNQRSDRPQGADESFSYILFGSTPVIVQYSSFEFGEQRQAVQFVPATTRARVSGLPG